MWTTQIDVDRLKKIVERLLSFGAKKKKVVAIIQVRMESKRLPGKAMLDLCGKPCLQHVIERVKLAKHIDEIVIATTLRKADDKIMDFIATNCPYVKPYRGETNDVYGRVLAAAQRFNADIIVDITADCPLVDPEIIDETVKNLIDSNKDYSSNVMVRSFADGMDVQAYTRRLMEKGNTIIVNEKDRENAGYNFIRYCTQFDCNLNFGIIRSENKFVWPKLRLTLDTKDDYKLLKKIFNYFKGIENDETYFNYKEVIEFLLKNPKLIKKKNLNFDAT